MEISHKVILRLLYLAAVRIHRGAVRAADAGIPVISVGNITAGGTGKTPLVLKIIETLGPDAAVVLRGYGRKERGVRAVETADAEKYGDEAVMIRRRFPENTVVVAENRYKGAIFARSSGASAVVLDDGFQSHEIRRVIDIVVIDCLDPFGGGLLPFGKLREPVKSLGRATAAVLNRADAVTPEGLKKIRQTVRNYIGETNIFEARETADALESLDGGSAQVAEFLAGKDVLCFCGIGNPAGFRLLIESLGARVAEAIEERDHHRWSRHELEEIKRQSESKGLLPVTTEKDFVRFPKGFRMKGFILKLATIIDNEKGFNEYILDKI